MSFTGTFHHTLDAKGRLIVPSRLRDEMEGDGARVVLTEWPEGCIAVWSGAGWAELEADLRRQRRNSPQSRSAVRRLASSAHTDEIDKQGRVTVPQGLREFAGIDRDVVIVGVLDHVELWSPDRLEAEKEQVGDLNEVFGALEL